MEALNLFHIFYGAIEEDSRISSTHISIYMALLREWQVQGSDMPFKIYRKNIMRYAKINSRQTYNKVFRELRLYGFLSYRPSLNASTPSLIYLNYTN